MPAVAQQVDEDVALEMLPEIERELHHVAYGLRIVAVHMEHRALRHLGNVGAIRTAAPIDVVGSEAHLVVHHHMQGATGAVRLQSRHLHQFIDHALASDRGIAVNDHGAQLFRHERMVLFDQRTRNALHHRPHTFQVAGVGAQDQVHSFTLVGHHAAVEAHVVFHIAFHEIVLEVTALEVGEDGFVGLVEGVGQHVQTAPVGHADHHVVDAVRIRAVLDDGVQRRDQCFASFQAETLLTDELLPEETLEHHGLIQLAQDLLLLFQSKDRSVAVLFHPLLQPIYAVHITDEAVLHTDALAIRGLQMLKDGCQGGLADAQLRPGLEHGSEVILGQPEISQFQRGGIGTPLTHGVGMRKEVTTLTIAVDQGDHLELLRHVLIARPAVHAVGGPCLSRHFGITGPGQVETFEEPRPIRRYGAGVRFVLLIHPVN